MFREKTLILFDFDGTLIDSVPDLTLAVNLTLERLGHPGFEEPCVRVWVGNGARMLVERALRAAFGDDAVTQTSIDEALALFMDFYARHLSVHTVAYPDVPETLRLLRDSGYRMGIITNKPHAFVEPILQSLGMDTIFELIIGGDSLPQKKPHPMPLQHACETLGVAPEHSVMVGDSKNDILAAKAAGMHCIGVGYGYNYDEHISVYDPDLVVEDFGTLRASFGVQRA